MGSGCELSAQPVDEGGQHGRRIVYMAVPNLPIVYPVFAHHDCTHNQIISIHNRVCGQTLYQPVPAKMRKLRRFMRRVGKGLGFTKVWELDRVVQHYHGPKRRRYGEAADKLRANGITKRDSWVKMFIKCEKIKFQRSKPNPDPRAIQYRDPVYAVSLATYLKPIEERVYLMKGNRINGLPPTRVIGKGLNQVQRASLLRRKWNRFRKPVCFPLDASRFDQHITDDHLRCEHALYLAMNSSRTFATLLSWQLRNTVVTSRGIRYKTKGKRMSGDMNTAVGNCVLMVCMLALYFQECGVEWDCLDDGDDILLIIEQDDVERVMGGLEAHFRDLGMNMKVEPPSTTFEGIEWCQSRPVCVDGVWTFVRRPDKVLSGALVGNKWAQMKSVRSRRALANTIGLCEAILNAGVPVLSHFAQAIVRNADTPRQSKMEQSEQLLYRVRKELGKSSLAKIPVVAARQPSDATRLSFFKAFGVDSDTQLQWEAYLERWVFSLEEPEQHPQPISVGNWEWEADDVERF